jgi:cytochrome c-type biogenesis protein CcmF
MKNPGNLFMWLALVAVCVSSAGYLVAAFGRGREKAEKLARLGFVAFTAFVTIASVLLMHFILNHEFIYRYIAEYSSRDLSLEYLVSSFWAGQEGSFLLWVFFGAWLGILLMLKAGKVESQVMLLYNLNNLFLAILLIKQSPFQMLPIAPPEGQGLNMLLQDPWMVIHPPVVFLGYAAFTIPFAYAVSALWRREYDGWIKEAMPWTAFAFLTLGAGIIIGGYWSYKVLGWGGYWGWDPVENASLLPWLAGMALMHGMILQRTRKKLRKTNFLLAAFSFVLVIYCTFLTRSGILADFSVHSFVDLGITGWLVIFMFAFIAISLVLFLIRAKEIPVAKKGQAEGYVSREWGLIAAIVILCMCTLIVGLGTSAPLITRMLEKASKVSTEFYTDTNFPLALLMLFLLSLVPLMTWGKNNARRLVTRLIWAGLGALIALGVTLLSGYPGPGLLLLSLLAGAAAGTNLLLTIRLVRKKVTLSSGAIAHLGVGVMFLGIVASSIYDRSEKVLLPEGTAKSAMGYDITFTDPTFSKDGKGVRLYLPLDVSKGEKQFSAVPDIYSERTRDGQSRRFVHPHIRRGLVADLYISPIDFQPGRSAGTANEIVLEKGKTFHFHPYDLAFTDFDVSAMMGKREAGPMSVGANIEVSYEGKEPVTIKPLMTVGESKSPASRVKLPGPEDAYVTLTRMDATAKTITLIYEGPEGAETALEEKPPAVIAEVSVKPGMTLLWFGTCLILFGGCVAIPRRWQR